ncbi:class I adenylate-forming enzyme family protein [Haloglomus halophilum]|uniref:class I adenylate-forming enzyme family protein n=1 Tax=Haloglomus halophilum TaxID=2962672 RepID=UPI0020C95D7A|nr:class I adenylate-forming enzyme family protein [Haloglomus halophilum]
MKYHQQEPLRHVGAIPAMGADRYGEKRALEYRGEEYSYADLDRRADQVASALVELGVEPGDRVAMYVANSLQFPETFFGIVRTGAVAVPLNHRMDKGRLEYILDDAGVDVLVGSEVFPSVVKDLSAHVETTLIPGGNEDAGLLNYDEHVDSASDEFDRPERDFEDVCLQCYTSGTTGDPKGVLTTHRNVISTAQSYTETGAGDPEEDTTLLVLPLFHMYGLSVVLINGLYNGIDIVLKTLPVASALLGAIDDEDVTQFAGIPAIFIEMLNEYESNPEAYDLSSIETVGSGAAPLADDTRDRVEEMFGAQLIEGWGMTETTPAGTTNSVRGVIKGAGCIGRPSPDIELKLVDPVTGETRVEAEWLDPQAPVDIEEHVDFDDEESYTGEMAVRGPQVFEGYHNLPEKNEQVFDDEGWFYTDDIARVDEDRFLWMVDRADDMIIVGGENVYPAEVENALFDHPAVAEAAVVGADHEVKGQAPVAFVVLANDADPEEITERALREFALDRVPTYAHPRRVFFVDELPRSGTRKVQRYKLEDEAADRLGGPLSSSEEL